MNLFVAILAAVLFFALTPNILLRIPKNGSKYTVAAVHAVVFVIAFWLIHSLLKWIARKSTEKFSPRVDTKPKKTDA